MSDIDNTSAREGLPDVERARQDRRLIRAIKSGMPYTRIMNTYHVTQARLNKLAEAHGLTIAKPGNNKGIWSKR